MVRALDRPGSSSFLPFGDFEPQSGGSEGDGRTVAQDCRAQDPEVVFAGWSTARASASSNATRSSAKRLLLLSGDVAPQSGGSEGGGVTGTGGG